MANNGATPVLIVFQGAMAGNRWTLDRDVITLGRAADCDIVLPERQISRYHAQLERDATGGFVIRDLGSKNGTFVNGEAIGNQPYRLRDGDEIDLAGILHLGFVAGEATLPLGQMDHAPGRLQINPQTREVYLGRKVLDPPLSPAQFTLLHLLVTAEGRVVTRDEIITTVWPDAAGGVTDQAVDALIYRLRERLAELDPDTAYIVTVRGHGFRFAPHSGS